MSTLAITRNYSDGDDLTEAQLDAANDSIETWANGNIGATNIAASGVEAANIAASAVTAAKIASDAVTTAKILDANVTGAKLAATVVDDSTIARSSNQLIIKNSGVATAKIADGAVTQSKRAALGQQVSSSSSTFIHATTTITDVSNLSVSITTTGRPVFVGLIPDGSGNHGYINCNSVSGANAQLYIYRDAASIAEVMLLANVGVTGHSIIMPVGALYTIEVPSAGTYTYKARVKVSSANGTDVRVYYAKLIAYEL
jgi:hypothetical protein